MNLFLVEAEPEQDGTARTRTWLVVAGSLFEAIALIPDGYTPKSVSVQLAAASGPGRIIGWMGLPPQGLKQTPRDSGRATRSANHHRRRRAHAHQTSGWLAQTGP
jgi:hypothetical protein